MTETADDVQRRCRFPIFRGAITGRLVTCGVCPECRLAEQIRIAEKDERA